MVETELKLGQNGVGMNIFENIKVGGKFCLCFRRKKIETETICSIIKNHMKIHTGYIEVFMQGKCGRNTETTFDIK